MKNIQVPGVLWAALIIAAVALIHSNETYLMATFGVEPWVLDLAIGGLIAVLKSVKLGTDELNVALQIIDYLRTHPRMNQTATIVSSTADDKVQMRSSPGGTAIETDVVVAPAPPIILPAPVPERPNTALRWLMG